MAQFKHHSHFPKEKQIKNYLFPHVCFHCRKSFKKPNIKGQKICPECSSQTIMVDRKFSAPKLSDIEQWKKVEYLVDNGFLFQSVYEKRKDGGKYKVKYPKTLAEAKVFVETYKKQAVRNIS